MTIVQGATRQYKIGDATEWTAYTEQVDVEPGTTVAWQYVAGTGIWLKGTTEGSEVVNAETTVGASITAEDGSETNPYTIASVADLKKLATEVNDGNTFAGKFVTQTANIDLNNEAWDGIGKYDKKVESNCKSFAGIYDGQNKTISNLKLNNGNYKGLFNSVRGTSDSAKAVIKNLTVENISMVGGTGDYGMAAFVGGAVNAELINLTANGTSGTTFTHNSAGIAVHVNGHCSLKGCVNNIAITVAGDGKVAGIAAVLQGSDDQILEACTNTAAITGGNEAAGGLIDYCNTAVTFKDCANSGVITATKCNYGDSSIKAQFVTYGENGKARTLQGVNTALKSDVLVMGVTQVANAFGTTDGTTITFPVTPAVSGSYIALGKTAKPIVTLQKDEAITIDWNGFTADVSGITAAEGCKIEATGEGTITYTAVEAATPVKPGEVIECDDEEDAEKKAAEAEVVIEDKAAADAGQAKVVKAAAVKVGDKWTVQVVIDTAAEAYKAPEQAVPSVAEALAEIAAGKDPTIMVPAANVTPGLYYSIVGDSDVNFGNQVEGDRVLATGSNLSLKAPTVTGGKAFFKVSENLKPTPANP